ncbi:hypothetical protein D3C80_881920 [compost metagenome]
MTGKIAVDRVEPTGCEVGVGFADDVAAVVDVVNVSAIATDHFVGTCATIEGVATGAADQGVGQAVADQHVVEITAGQVLDVDQGVAARAPR